MGNKDRKTISAVPPCLPDNPTTSVRRQHAVCPITLALRRRILSLRRSLRPPRPICCPAYRSALSYAELSVDAPCSFTPASMVSCYVMNVIHQGCPFVKRFFSQAADKPLRQHRIMGQGDSARDFGTSESTKNAGILDVFPIFRTARLGQKIRRSPQLPPKRCCLNTPGRRPGRHR